MSNKGRCRDFKGGKRQGVERIKEVPRSKIVNGYKTYPIVAGEFAITRDSSHVALSTILGSCVALMLYDGKTKIKAMNHFVLPASSSKTDCYRFGLYSIESMFNEMLKLGVKKEHVVAKIAGGANVLHSVSSNTGLKNVNFAREFCKSENIRITAENTLGEHGREVLLIHNFQTYIRKIGSRMRDEHLLQEEKRYQKQIQKKSAQTQSCDITLF